MTVAGFLALVATLLAVCLLIFLFWAECANDADAEYQPQRYHPDALPDAPDIPESWEVLETRISRGDRNSLRPN